jgi:cytoskeleton protein RodZ
MSTDQRDVTAPTDDVRQASGLTQNPGASLQAGREGKGLSTADVAGSLRLPEKILIHLEAGRFENLPGDTFARGYVRSYARLLGLDTNQLVLEYDRYRGVEVREQQVIGIDKLSQPGEISGMLVTWTTVVVAIVILASILLWWYDSQPEPPGQDVSSIAGQAIDEVEVDAMSLPVNFADESTVFSSGSPDPLNAPTGTEEDASATSDLPESEIPAEGAPAQTQIESAAPIPSQASADSGTSESGTTAVNNATLAAGQGLQMRFSGNCWLKVTTPGGEVLHSALMQAGQTLSLEHQGPMDVVIGAVEAVSLIAFNGEPVDTQGTRASGVVRLRLG